MQRDTPHLIGCQQPPQLFAAYIAKPRMVRPPVSHYVMLRHALDILDGTSLSVCLSTCVISADVSTTVMTYLWLSERCACSSVTAAASAARFIDYHAKKDYDLLRLLSGNVKLLLNQARGIKALSHKPTWLHVADSLHCLHACMAVKQLTAWGRVTL